MDPEKYQREIQIFIMRVTVGDVPNSGYMLRFTQERACLRISTKPVDMPEDCPQLTHRSERTWGILIKQKKGQRKFHDLSLIHI